jgi:hypothetical protein
MITAYRHTPVPIKQKPSCASALAEAIDESACVMCVLIDISVIDDNNKKSPLEEVSMAGLVRFTRDYGEFGNQVREFEKTEDVTLILGTWAAGVSILTQPPTTVQIPLGRIIVAKIAAERLSQGSGGDESELSLIFRVVDPEFPGIADYVIVMRSEGEAWYGGSLLGDDETLVIRDDIVRGHRVLETKSGTDKVTWEYHYNTSRYEFADVENGEKIKQLLDRKRQRRYPRHRRDDP